MTRRPKPGKASKKAKQATRDLRDKLAALGPMPSYADAFTVEQAAEVARQQVRWLRQRDAITETHRKCSRISDPGLLQERHSPTVEIAVDDPAGKRRARRNITRVRQSEAWRHNNLDGMQRQAESEMHLAWMLRTVGLAAHTLRLDRHVAGAMPISDSKRAELLEETWRDWMAEAPLRGIKIAAVVMTFSEPRTLPEIERACHLKRGQAIEVYRRGLELWAELRGWLRPAVVPPHNGML